MSSVGTVVIGRNEGELLARSLDSVPSGRGPLVYVDSCSSDDSVEVAKRRGSEVLVLDERFPPSAARGRNAGARHFAHRMDAPEFVQFVDGDCTLEPDWLETALAYMQATPEAVVCFGRLRERYPDVSIYNALCDLEWRRPLGKVASCGGIFLVRAQAFHGVGGFDESIRAGEEPELCERLRADGGEVHSIDVPMAQHDAELTSFQAWWTRQRRGGRGAMEVAERFAHPGFRQQARSTRMWSVGWLLTSLLFIAVGAVLGGAAGAALGLVAGVGLWLLQAARIALKAARRGFSLRLAVAHGALTLVAKWPQLLGQWDWSRERDSVLEAARARVETCESHSRMAA